MAAKRLLLLMPVETYRATDFIAAARALGVEVVVGLDQPPVTGQLAPGATLALPFLQVEPAVEQIAALHRHSPLDAVVAVDDAGVVLAARACEVLGLPGNPAESVVSSANKLVLREIMRAAGLPGPWFQAVPLSADPVRAAAQVRYPCVLKPLFLSASRGVIRADDERQFVAAFQRIARLLADPELRQRGGLLAEQVLAEQFLSGPEVALEGMVIGGRFKLLSFLDKPDPLDGPCFEETLFITPSRHPQAVQQACIQAVDAAVQALGLRTGPVHAELRLGAPQGHPAQPVLLELATRSIGGHCSRALRFGTGLSLEEVILRQALGLVPSDALPERERAAAGVMMIPIPAAGKLVGVAGLEAARAVPGISGVEISIPLGQAVVPLPEGHRYLGFIFGTGGAPEQVEAALREAHRCLRLDIRPAASAG